MINQDQLNYELYRRTDKEFDVYYYRQVTSSADSCPKIIKHLEQFTEGFPSSNVSLERFKKDYEFGKHLQVKEWIRFYADQGLMLKVSDLYQYISEVV